MRRYSNVQLCVISIAMKFRVIVSDDDTGQVFEHSQSKFSTYSKSFIFILIYFLRGKKQDSFLLMLLFLQHQAVCHDTQERTHLQILFIGESM